VVFLSSTRLIPGWNLKLDKDRFLPHPFQFIINPAEAMQRNLKDRASQNPHLADVSGSHSSLLRYLPLHSSRHSIHIDVAILCSGCIWSVHVN
jgi:hypothetical protein